MNSEIQNALGQLRSALQESYADHFGVNRIDGDNLPRRDEIINITEKLLDIIFPGFDCRFTGTLEEIFEELSGQIARAIKYNCKKDCCGKCHADEEAETAALALLKALPEIRETAKDDVRAGYAGDPAATSFDEIILSYPGLKAITIQRLAHVLYLNKVPMIGRMMTEHAHSLTGIDIHPGATLGKGVFIDHGTGVVIGETAILGDNVRIYQGVTLGAVAFPKDACGMLIKGNKRHPTLGNNVTVYSGASVLGDITIGDNSVIGGNVWLTESLPPGTKITARPPEHNLKLAAERSEK
ncbi:MAG: serine acetyltransferase [Lentisphaeria bacterium]|nr:serine acetyltransferase [Lentisphaeria bacterium]